MMRKIFLLFLLAIIQFDLYAQEIVTIKMASGEYILSPKSEISLKMAFEKAVNEAKLNALRKAGVAENISSSDILTSSEKDIDFKQELNSILSIELSGAVLKDSIIEESTSINEFGNTVVRVVLNAEVIKYNHKADPSFDFKVEGIKEYYDNDELMKFTFFPFSDGYLTIFAINDLENYFLYPYQDRQNKYLNDIPNLLFGANQKIQFPVNKLMGNPLTKEGGYLLSTELEREQNSLIFVFTKQIFPFKKKISYKNIIAWIYTISPEKRKVQFFDFVIANK